MHGAGGCWTGLQYCRSLRARGGGGGGGGGARARVSLPSRSAFTRAFSVSSAAESVSPGAVDQRRTAKSAPIHLVPSLPHRVHTVGPAAGGGRTNAPTARDSVAVQITLHGETIVLLSSHLRACGDYKLQLVPGIFTGEYS